MVLDHFIEHAAVTQGDHLIVSESFQVDEAMTLHFRESAETMKIAYCKLFKISKAKFENGDALFRTIDEYLALSKPILKLLSEPDYSLAENYRKTIEAMIASEKGKKPKHEWENLYHALINLVSLIGSIVHQLDDNQKKGLPNILEQLRENGAAPFTVPLRFCGVSTAMMETIYCFSILELSDGKIKTSDFQALNEDYRSASDSIIVIRRILSIGSVVMMFPLGPFYGLGCLIGGLIGAQGGSLIASGQDRKKYKPFFRYYYWYIILISCYSRYLHESVLC